MLRDGGLAEAMAEMGAGDCVVRPVIEHDRGGLAMIDEVGTLRAHRERG